MPAQTSIHTSFHQPTNTKTNDEQEEVNQKPKPEKRPRNPRDGKEIAFAPDQQKISTDQQSHENLGESAKQEAIFDKSRIERQKEKKNADLIQVKDCIRGAI
jgi:hypothetical protein